MIRTAVPPARCLLAATSLVLLSVTPLSATAEGPRELQATEVRAAFASAGLPTGEPGAWTEDGVVMFAVDDPAVGLTGHPQLRVFVYRSASAAAAAHQQAHAQDEARRNRTISFSDQLGPQLLTGYGASAWTRNVALVQASDPTDVGSFSSEPDCVSDVIGNADLAAGVTSRDFALPSTRVDSRFVDVVATLP
jgi:hypothetical protein